MTSIETIKMPKRFDYNSSVEFNSGFVALLNKCVGSGSKVIVLDAIQLEYIDSAGIGLLVMAHKKAQTAQVKISMINARSSPKEILLLANLQKLIEII
jgi:anti-anti-sigma factor